MCFNMHFLAGGRHNYIDLPLSSPYPKVYANPWWTVIPKNKTNQNKQQYIGIQYQQTTSLNFTEIPRFVKKLKQIRACSGSGIISQYINITEFPSPRTFLESK